MSINNVDILKHRIEKKIYRLNVYKAKDSQVFFVSGSKNFFNIKKKYWTFDEIISLKKVSIKEWQFIANTLGRNFKVFVTGFNKYKTDYWDLYDENYVLYDKYRVFIIFFDFILVEPNKR